MHAHKRLLILFVLAWTLFPLLWAVSLSLKQPIDFFTAKFVPFVSFQPTLDNWRAEWRNFDDPVGMGHSLGNSLLVAIVSSSISLVLGSLAAFALTQGRLSRNQVWRWMALSLLPRILPPAVIAIPYAALVTLIHMNDTAIALIFAHVALSLPLVILMMRSVMIELPANLIEAAQVDGCGWMGALWRIALPLLVPALLSVGTLCFAQSWNEFPFALLNVQHHMPTAPLAVAALLNKDGIEFEFVGSHLVLVTLPPLLVGLLAQRFLVRGLSLGMVTGD